LASTSTNRMDFLLELSFAVNMSKNIHTVRAKNKDPE